MIRRRIRSYTPPILLLLLAIASPIQSAQSQDRTVQDRLDRLERDLSMLQRQVYRGAGPSATGPGSSAAVDIEVRMDRLEAQMRDLTGRVEEAMNSVDQLRARLEQINSDIDVRLGQEESQPTPPPRRPPGGGGAIGSAPGALAARGSPPPASPTPLMPPSSPMAPGTMVPSPPYARWVPGTLTPPGGPAEAAADPVNPGPGGGGLRTPSPGVLHEGSVAEQYNYAFGLLKQADYPAAEEALKSFIHNHPNDPLAGSAQYWLGETYYQRADYADAASAFAEGYKRYPKGTKAADELLKLGMSLARANQKQNACVAFAQLDREFPNPTTAIKERAKDEKKKLGC
jgi:tol-pal system protein YbgF